MHLHEDYLVLNQHLCTSSRKLKHGHRFLARKWSKHASKIVERCYTAKVYVNLWPTERLIWWIKAYRNQSLSYCSLNKPDTKTLLHFFVLLKHLSPVPVGGNSRRCTRLSRSADFKSTPFNSRWYSETSHPAGVRYQGMFTFLELKLIYNTSNKFSFHFHPVLLEKDFLSSQRCTKSPKVYYNFFFFFIFYLFHKIQLHQC